MKHRDNESNDLLHCKNCDGYYDPSLPNCPHCGEETANNTMEGNGGHTSVTQYGGGFGPAGSTLSRVSLLIIAALLLIALVTAVWLCFQALSQVAPDTSATSSQVEEDPADTSAQGDVSDSAASGSVSAQPEEEAKTVEAETLTLDLYDLTLSEGESYDLTATVSPEDWEGTYIWSSDDESVATVKQNGLVAYVGEGECTITVSAGGLTAQCVVHCNAPTETEEPEETEQEETEVPKTEENTTSIVLEFLDITLTNIGDGYTFSPSGGNGTYTWSSADPSIATVNSSGYVTGVSKGNTTVTCTSGDESVTIIVRVAPN